MKKIYVLAGVALMMTACGNNEKEYDAGYRDDRVC